MVLQKQVKAEASAADTLNNLTVYLTLQKAEKMGFKADKYGLSGDQAADLHPSVSTAPLSIPCYPKTATNPCR